MGMLEILQIAPLTLVLWLLWRRFGSLLVRSPLYDVPGPPPESFFKGRFGRVRRLIRSLKLSKTPRQLESVFRSSGFIMALCYLQNIWSFVQILRFVWGMSFLQ